MANWREIARLRAKHPRFKSLLNQTQARVGEFLALNTPGYVSFSCGKDSSVLAHLVLQQAPGYRLRFLSSGETRLLNPGIDVVIDGFSAYGARIEEILIDRVFSEEWKTASWDTQRKAGKYDMRDALADPTATLIFMGLRGEESFNRRRSLTIHQTPGLPKYGYRYVSGRIRACPVADWSTIDIAAYHHVFDLPLLTAYEYGGFETRTTARLTGDAARSGGLSFLRDMNYPAFLALKARFPELFEYQDIEYRDG